MRHVVLSAFGCGAFKNPAHEVARIYREELHKRAVDFDVVSFAIYNAGYGPDNYDAFVQAFEDWPCGGLARKMKDLFKDDSVPGAEFVNGSPFWLATLKELVAAAVHEDKSLRATAVEHGERTSAVDAVEDETITVYERSLNPVCVLFNAWHRGHDLDRRGAGKTKPSGSDRFAYCVRI